MCLYICVTSSYLDRERTYIPAGRELSCEHRLTAGRLGLPIGFLPKHQLVLKCRVCPYAGAVNCLTTRYTNLCHIRRFAGWKPRSIQGNLWIIFAFYSPILRLMFPGPESSKLVVVQCKGCHENIPAPVEGMPAQPIAAKCPLCHDHRRYLPSEVFLGRLSHLMMRKPVRTADGRIG